MILPFMVPVVLHHGIFGFLNFKIGKLKLSTFGGGIEDAIEARGHPLIVSKVHPTAGIASRAAQLQRANRAAALTVLAGRMMA